MTIHNSSVNNLRLPDRGGEAWLDVYECDGRFLLSLTTHYNNISHIFDRATAERIYHALGQLLQDTDPKWDE